MFSSYGDAWTRTSTMANVGVVLAQRRNRVACTSLVGRAHLMDLLLAGPGDVELDELQARPGLFDLLFEYTQALLAAPYDPRAAAPAAPAEDCASLGTLRLRRPSSCLTRAAIAVPGNEPLFVLRGGPRAPATHDAPGGAEHRMDWAGLRHRWGGDLYLEWLKLDLVDHVDFLLVDCDLTGDGYDAVRMLATSAADTLVMLSNYSDDQTVSAHHFLTDLTNSDASPHRPNPLSILPVPAGIELSEMDLRARGQKKFVSGFAKFLPENWDDELLREYEIPETPAYHRLGNKLVTWNYGEGSWAPPVTPYARLADAILRTRGTAVSSTAEILSQRIAELPSRNNWDVFVSYSTDDQELAIMLRRHFAEAGLRSFVAQYDLAAHIGSSEWLAAMRRVLGRSRVLVALVTASARKSEWVAQECRDFDALVHDRGQGLIVPVCLSPVTPRDLDQPLNRYQAIDSSNGLSETALAQLIDLVRGALRH